MKTDNEKYYVVSNDGVFVLAIEQEDVYLNTLKEVTIFDNEEDYNEFKSSLEGGDDELE